MGEYGLRNKHELRRHETMLSKIRGIARSLLAATEEQRTPMESQYLKRLARLGILPETAGIDNILDLTVKDLMERRLQTMVFRQGLARTIHQARQFVSHGHISLSGQIVTVPGYIVEREEESKILFHLRSPLNSPQHPARVAVGAKRLTVPRVVEGPGAPTVPALPEVPAEIKEIAQTEQPIEIPEPEEELAPAAEETPKDESQQPN